MSTCGYINFGSTPGSDVRYLKLTPVLTGVIPPNASVPGDVGQNYSLVVNNTWLSYFNGSIFAPCPSVYLMDLMDAQTLLITLPPIGGAYNISEPELITFTVPASVVASSRSYIAFPLVSLLPIRGSAELSSSSSLVSASEAGIRANHSTLVITLEDEEFLPERLADIFMGLTARQSDPSGWNAVVQPRLHEDFAQFNNSNRTLTISLPPFPTYDVVSAETIVLLIPDAAIKSRQRPHNHLQLVIDTVAGLAQLNG
eukprot:4852095-Prymnesium_polylepis.1